MSTIPGVDRAAVPTPRSFDYWRARETPRWRRRERLAKVLLRHDLFPSDEQVASMCADQFRGDPVAEAFVDEVFFGAGGHRAGRRLLDQALTDGIDAVDDPPASMRALFAEFETVPDWVDRDLVEAGAAVWRRWGTMLFSVAGATTLEMYTEGAVAVPLSLAGGYAGDNALRRFLETCRFWIDVSEPGALFEPGSAGRRTAMQVRVMHVSVRRRVGDHPEWDAEAWGVPISQMWAQMTQIGGAVAPALALWLAGVHTTPREMRALIHFNRYLGHLLGVQPLWPTDSIREQLQALAMTAAARSYDSGDAGRELIESFPAAFAPRDGQSGWHRWRARYNHTVHGAYCALWMAPATRRRYDLPSPLPAIAIPLARLPLVHAAELARRLPGLRQLQAEVADRHRKNWWAWQMQGRQAEFDASSALRR